MAYASKYYDPVKAHEYYMKHRVLKGRKRKRSSIADLNEQGKAAAQEVKERLNEELKAALKKLPKGATAKRKELREKYHEMYLQELDKIKQDTAMQKQAKTTKNKQKQAKSPGAKSSGSSRSSGSTAKTAKATTTAETKTEAKTEEPKVLTSEDVRIEAETAISSIKEKAQSMTPEERAKVKKRLNDLIAQISRGMTS